MRFRRWYYDRFSRFYDRFVQAHSKDSAESLRSFLAETLQLKPGHTVLDLCTGTGSSALAAARHEGVRVIGIDFSLGMLREALRKSPPENAPFWVQADVQMLPVGDATADRVSCSYAIYELSREVRNRMLSEVVRVLKPGGRFVMMEHLPPEKPLVRLLYVIRIYVLGTRGVRSFAGSEEAELKRFFAATGTIVAPSGRTKAVYGTKAE